MAIHGRAPCPRILRVRSLAVLLKVTIEEAEYWERGRSEVIPLAAVAREPHDVRIKSQRASREPH